MDSEQRIAYLEEQLAAANRRLDTLDPKPKAPEPISVDLILRKALEKMDGDPSRATDLFLMWCEQSSQTRESLRPLIREAIDRRVAALTAPTAE